MSAKNRTLCVLGVKTRSGSRNSSNVSASNAELSDAGKHMPAHSSPVTKLTTLASVNKIKSLIGWTPSVDLLDWIGKNNE